MKQKYKVREIRWIKDTYDRTPHLFHLVYNVLLGLRRCQSLISILIWLWLEHAERFIVVVSVGLVLRRREVSHSSPY